MRNLVKVYHPAEDDLPNDHLVKVIKRKGSGSKLGSIREWMRCNYGYVKLTLKNRLNRLFPSTLIEKICGYQQKRFGKWTIIWSGWRPTMYNTSVIGNWTAFPDGYGPFVYSSYPGGCDIYTPGDEFDISCKNGQEMPDCEDFRSSDGIRKLNLARDVAYNTLIAKLKSIELGEIKKEDKKSETK